jgi:hypothetical protein
VIKINSTYFGEHEEITDVNVRKMVNLKEGHNMDCQEHDSVIVGGDDQVIVLFR